MDAVSKTLYIPLYGKALVSRMGRILSDPKAEDIWACAGFPLKGKAASKWLAYYMGMRSAVFDRWVTEKIAENPGACVLHLGCGLDSRCLRVETTADWYDVDFPEVIDERKQYYAESTRYHMISSDIRAEDWLSSLPAEEAVVVMEGISMYLRPEELSAVLRNLRDHFSRIHLLTDCYTEFAAKASRYKNPINTVGVTEVFGLDDPKALASGGLSFLREVPMTPEDLIAQLSPMEQKIFRKLYAGKFASRLYRMYEYKG
jgi:O-methyltransferase involved in polyketide biosynthesis